MAHPGVPPTRVAGARPRTTRRLPTIVDHIGPAERGTPGRRVPPEWRRSPRAALSAASAPRPRLPETGALPRPVPSPRCPWWQWWRSGHSDDRHRYRGPGTTAARAARRRRLGSGADEASNPSPRRTSFAGAAVPAGTRTATVKRGHWHPAVPAEGRTRDLDSLRPTPPRTSPVGQPARRLNPVVGLRRSVLPHIPARIRRPAAPRRFTGPGRDAVTTSAGLHRAARHWWRSRRPPPVTTDELTDRARVPARPQGLSLTPGLPGFPQVAVHEPQRGHLSRHPGLDGDAGGRHRQRRHHRLPGRRRSRGARRHRRHLPGR